MLKNEYSDMDNEVKLKWITALRSGNYKQCFGKLRYEADRFCAVGVLCDIFQKETGRKINWIGNTIPRNVREWAGLHASAIFVSTPTTLEYPHGREGKLLLLSRENLEKHWKSYGYSDAQILREMSRNYFWRRMEEWNDVWHLAFEDIAFLLEFGTIDGRRKW